MWSESAVTPPSPSFSFSFLLHALGLLYICHVRRYVTAYVFAGSRVFVYSTPPFFLGVCFVYLIDFCTFYLDDYLLQRRTMHLNVCIHKWTTCIHLGVCVYILLQLSAVYTFSRFSNKSCGKCFYFQLKYFYCTSIICQYVVFSFFYFDFEY